MSSSRPADPGAERSSIRAALLALVLEDGYPPVTLAALLERAAVDGETFERHFASLDECFAATWETVDAELCTRMGLAFADGDPWRSRMRAALAAGLAFLAEDEGLARLYVADVFFAGGGVRERHRASMERFAAMIDIGRREGRGSFPMPAIVADGIAGGVWHCVYRLVASGRSSELPGELAQLMYLVVLPYLGVKAAEAELRNPLP